MLCLTTIRKRTSVSLWHGTKVMDNLIIFLVSGTVRGEGEQCLGGGKKVQRKITSIPA